jgi:hypothetical protein
MRKASGTIILAACVALLAAPAAADWDVGDPHKMHSPQLPKVDGGYDVKASYYRMLADDFQCSESGYINDIHVWVSFYDDVYVDPNTVHLAIWSDDPVGEGGLRPDNTYSMPSERLWHGDTTTWTSRLWDTGDQGWYDPQYGTSEPPPQHQNCYQMNFLFDDAEAFWQEKDTIYWLEFSIQDPVEMDIGWKESDDHWNDDAVWRTTANEEWEELWDPTGTYSMDMAFVITPEPASMAMLAIGGLAVMIRRRR